MQVILKGLHVLHPLPLGQATRSLPLAPDIRRRHRAANCVIVLHCDSTATMWPACLHLHFSDKTPTKSASLGQGLVARHRLEKNDISQAAALAGGNQHHVLP